MNRADRRRQLSTLTKAPDVGQRFAADMRVATDLHKQGRLKEAADLYRKIVRVYDGLPDIRVALSNLGAALQGLGKGDEAIQALKKARALRPDAPAPHHNLGMAYLNQGRLVDAIESLTSAIERDQGFRDAWIGLALACERAGDAPRAEAALRRALDADPNSVEARYNLGNLLRRTGRPDEAVQEFGICLEIEPRFMEAHFTIGRTREEQGDLAAAAGAYLEALRLGPLVEGVNNQMGVCLQQLAKADAATARDMATLWRQVAADSPTAHHMAAALLGETPPRADDAFLRVQFDQFAQVYDQALTAIGNRAPELLRAAVDAALPPAAGALYVLDAGCGTGLLGPWLRPYARTLEGVDISPGMIVKADERQVYDRLVSGELGAFLADKDGGYDLIAAGDVLPYFGELKDLLAAVSKALCPGGHLAGTVESAPDAADSFVLRPTGRFAHGEKHLKALLKGAGLKLVSLSTDTLRQERDEPITGHVFVARKG